MGFKITTNFERATAAMDEAVRGRLKEVTANALTNTAFEARAAVQGEMRKVFRNPEPITLNAVAVVKADPTQSVDEQFAMVWIRDDYPKATTQPARYLLAQEQGGQRGDKRSERALTIRGILGAGQQLTPGPGAPLDSHGQVSGAGMVKILSRIGGLAENGYSGNASAASKAKLLRTARSRAAAMSKMWGGSKADIKAARAAAKPFVHKASGTEFFLMKSRLAEGFAGVFQLAGKGRVRPVLWFATKRPIYRPRFPFRQVVAKAALEKMPRQWVRALKYVAGRN